MGEYLILEQKDCGSGKKYCGDVRGEKWCAHGVYIEGGGED